MQNALRAYINGDIPGAQFAIYYQIGDPFYGETYFHIQGDGAYEAWSTVTDGRERLEFNGRLDAARVRTLAQTMLDAQVWNAQHGEDMGEDDPPVVIGVEASGQDHPVELWVSELKRNPAFVRVQTDILGLVREVSGGKILEVGQ